MTAALASRTSWVGRTARKSTPASVAAKLRPAALDMSTSLVNETGWGFLVRRPSAPARGAGGGLADRIARRGGTWRGLLRRPRDRTDDCVVVGHPVRQSGGALGCHVLVGAPDHAAVHGVR